MVGRATGGQKQLLDPNGHSPAQTGQQVYFPILNVPGYLATAVCAGNPAYNIIPASNSICRWSNGCTAWFVQTEVSLPQGQFAMATAGHCVVEQGAPGAYTVDPANPGEDGQHELQATE